MFKSLYFKIVLILLIFIVAVMCAVASILMNGVSAYYVNQFGDQMEECFGQNAMLYRELNTGTGDAAAIKEILASYGSILGIDAYRNYYVLDGSGYIFADETCRTSIPGVFAAGDVRTKHLRQIVTACADGATAIKFAEEWLTELE